jgi:N-acetylmuramoyl-L-alanine amidase
MLKKTITIFTCFLILTTLFSFSKERKSPVIRTIIIDAGHGIKKNGGYDGAQGSYSSEDEICLAIAKKLVADITKTYPNIRIVETRPGREKVDLHERSDIANQNNGDLFISIHVNAMPPIQHRELVGYKTETYYTGKGKKRKKHTKKVPQYHYYTTPHPAKGTQTYIWGAHKTEDKEVAIRENAPMFAEDNYKEKYGDIDPNSPEFIALSLVKTKQFFKRSSTLASMVESEFAKAGRVSQGSYQRQVGIWVLQATAMPSILVETGFITNRSEEDYLNSENGQQETANCITQALGNYINWLEKQQTSTTVAPQLPGVKSNKTPLSFLEAVENREKSLK